MFLLFPDHRLCGVVGVSPDDGVVIVIAPDNGVVIVVAPDDGIVVGIGAAYTLVVAD